MHTLQEINQVLLDQELLAALKSKQDLEKIKDLVNQGANVNAIDINDSEKNPALFWAILLETTKSSGYMDVVEYLVARGANVNAQDAKGNTILHVIACTNRPDLIEKFIKYGTKVNTRNEVGRTPLHNAVEDGWNLVIEKLCEYHADINAKDENDTTPLMLAVYGNHYKVSEILLENAAEVNAQDNMGRSALHFAAGKGFTKLIQLLFDKGHAKIDLPEKDLRTPLHIAVIKNQLESVKVLIKLGADVEAKDVGTLRPLHYAVSNGYVELTRLLLEVGADYKAVACGLSVIDYAKKFNQLEIWEILHQCLISDERSRWLTETPAQILKEMQKEESASLQELAAKSKELDNLKQQFPTDQVQKNIEDMQLELKQLEAASKLRKAEEAAIETFKDNINLWHYYVELKTCLDSMLQACHVGSSGIISLAREGKTGKVGDILKLIGSWISAAPIAGIAGTIINQIADVLNNIGQQRQKNLFKKISLALGTALEISNLSANVARALTEKYQTQLTKLISSSDQLNAIKKEKHSFATFIDNIVDKASILILSKPELSQAQIVADWAVLQIWGGLLDENFNTDEPLQEQFINFLTTSNVANDTTIKALIAKAFKTDILITQNGDTWHLAQLYQSALSLPPVNPQPVHSQPVNSQPVNIEEKINKIESSLQQINSKLNELEEKLEHKKDKSGHKHKHDNSKYSNNIYSFHHIISQPVSIEEKVNKLDTLVESSLQQINNRLNELDEKLKYKKDKHRYEHKDEQKHENEANVHSSNTCSFHH